jgi:hypothetical protein
MSRCRIVIFPYTVTPKSVIIFFNIFISIIIVAEFRDIVVKFTAVSAKISTINTFFAYNIRPIIKDVDFFVVE